MGPGHKCLFVEIEPWEAERIRSRERGCGSLITVDAALQDAGIDDTSGIVVLSPFIHSRVTAGAIERFRDLRFIATRSTGYDHIDLAACRERGITVSNVPYYGANTVAEHTFALLLALTRRVHKAYMQTSRGRFSIEGLRGIDLRNRTLGVVGTGSIGTHVIRIALGFQMPVLAYDVKPVWQMADALGFRYVDLDTLLAESDIITLHAPYMKETHHMIDRDAIAKMKKGAILINTARGALVNTEDLVEALRSGKLGGAGLDVLEDEQVIMEEGEMLSRRYDAEALGTLVSNTILLRMENVIITPHIAFNSEEALDKILETTIANIGAFLAGQPQNVVAAPD
ncbi:MAG: hydroxyacid dehydrogenase [Planctomycetota bacterium]|jgi:D-lactate dehydrogenase